ncbi:MAG: hypothetical protein WAT19_03910 [Ferruginibacter sp.]
MKPLITIALLALLAPSGFSQIVNIPDANFKAAIIAQGVDANNDGQIQLSEAEAISNLIISLPVIGGPINDYTGIQAFRNLVDFTLNNNPGGSGTTLNLSSLTNLNFLYVLNTNDTLINISGCTALSIIYISGLPRLKVLDISTCTSIRNLDINGAVDLRKVEFGVNCPLQTFYLSDAGQTGFINLEEFDVSGCHDLWQLHMRKVNIDTLSLFTASQASNVQLDYSNIETINLSNDSLYSLIIIGDLSLQKINFLRCANLRAVDLSTYYLNRNIGLDFSPCPRLDRLTLDGPGGLNNFNVKYLNLKNGSALTFLSTMGLNDTDSLYICADAFELDTLYSYFSIHHPGKPVFISDSCSFFPGNNNNTIKGTIRIDANNNGCDSTDRGLANLPVRFQRTGSSSIVTRFTVFNGRYAYYDGSGSYLLTPQLANPYFSISPASASVNFDTVNNLSATRDFCAVPVGVHNDLETILLPLGLERPGFPVLYQLIYRNKGNTILNGTAALHYDNNKMNFDSAATPVTAQTPGSLQWTYSNLQPFESRSTYVFFTVLAPPVNNNGDTLVLMATVDPLVADETPADNSFTLQRVINGSFDPNDKQCLQGPELHISKVGEYLHYLVRFQNEGTDTAFNITVRDTLSAKYEWGSAVFTGSSHFCDVTLKDNQFSFFFKDILLPHKTVNEPASHGWIAYKIKPSSTVAVGDTLANKASIYFDFNLPVVTNTASTIIHNRTVAESIAFRSFRAVKETGANKLNWEASCSAGTTIFNVERSDDGLHFYTIGAVFSSQQRCLEAFSFSDANPVAGTVYYRVKMTTVAGKIIYTNVITLGTIEEDLQVLTVGNGTLLFNSKIQEEVDIMLTGVDGKNYYNIKYASIIGRNSILLPLKKLARGIYIISINRNNGKGVHFKFLN